MSDLISSFLSAIKSVLDSIWRFLFGDLDLGVLFAWCPADIRSAVAVFIGVLFLLVVVKFVRNFLPV